MASKLEPRLVIRGDESTPHVSGDLFIAAYQRGYRWGKAEVRQLLEDLKAAFIGKSAARDYYLQPVVVIDRGDNVWELVDGQQRLTTLLLLVKHIQSELPRARVGYTITYESRSGSREFLESLDPELRERNADYFHMLGAFEEIQAWFDEQPNLLQAAIDIHSALSRWVYVIWYEAPASTNPNELFARLNRDRIPLTDAELIKALVLSQNGAAEGRSGRQEEIAAQWDSFERDLRDDRLWAFLTATSDRRSTHIDFLFDTMTQDVLDDTSLRYTTFFAVRKKYFDGEQDQGVAARRFWSAVVERHGLLTGWFNDRVLYHRVGFLVASGVTIGDLVDRASEMTHSEFAHMLKDLIRADLRISPNGLSELRYGRDDSRIAKVLLLMNVQTVLASTDSTSRFPFEAFASGFAKGKSSLEHIHAQNSESLKTEAQWRTWLLDHEERIERRAWSDGQAAEAKDVSARLRAFREAAKLDKDSSARDQLVADVFALFSEPESGGDGDTHGLGNLALLQRDINSSLNNAVFDVKRQRILELDFNGAFILPCTRNVFLKYYTLRGDQSLHLWTAQDRDAYFNRMVDLLSDFLLSDESDEAAA